MTTDRIFGQHERSEHVEVGTTRTTSCASPTEPRWTRLQDGGSAAGELGLLTLANIPTAIATVEDLSRIAGPATDLVVSAYDHPRLAIVFSADPERATPA